VERVKKTTMALYASKKMFRSTWGLSPALMHWVYISAVRPTLLYEALVWWQATKNSELMARTQLQALVCITGALRSTPTKALETILGIDPIDIHAQLTAGKAAQRLVASGNMTTQSFGHSLIGIKPNQQNGLHDPVHWLYTAIVRPILLYGNIVWWPSLEKNCNLRILHKIRRSSELCISGALRTTATEAFNTILDLQSLDLLAKSWASATALRLREAAT